MNYYDRADVEQVLVLLKSAREVISDRKRWTRRCEARDAHSREIPPWSHKARRFCAVGVLRRDKPRPFTTRFLAIKTLNWAAECRGYPFIVTANDDVGHKAALACYDDAIRTLEEALQWRWLKETHAALEHPNE